MWEVERFPCMLRMMLVLTGFERLSAEQLESEIVPATDSFAPSSLTILETRAERSEGSVPIATHVKDGRLAVDVGVGAHESCTFGGGPTERSAKVASSFALDVDADDAKTWLFSGASIECDGKEPLYAWTELEARVVAPKIADITLEDRGDPMLSERDEYVVRLRASSLAEIERATIAVGGASIEGRIQKFEDEETSWSVVFDVPSDAWVSAALAQKSGTFVARVAQNEIEESIDFGLGAVVAESGAEPID